MTLPPQRGRGGCVLCPSLPLPLLRQTKKFLHVLGITSSDVFLIGGDVHDGTDGDGNVLIAGGVAGTDLGALGVEGNGDGSSRVDVNGSAHIVNDRLVVLVAAVGEVHTGHVQAGITKLVEGLDRVGLGADGADDGSAAKVAGRGEGCVEGGQPIDAATDFQVLLGRGRHDADGARGLGDLGHG